MKDSEIQREILELMEQAQKRDEMLLTHVKLIHKRISCMEHVLETVISLLRFPEGEERDAAWNLLKNSYVPGSDRDEIGRLVALHESLHETAQADLGKRRSDLETLEGLD